jgi:hypothetical protein
MWCLIFRHHGRSCTSQSMSSFSHDMRKYAPFTWNAHPDMPILTLHGIRKSSCAYTMCSSLHNITTGTSPTLCAHPDMPWPRLLCSYDGFIFRHHASSWIIILIYSYWHDMTKSDGLILHNITKATPLTWYAHPIMPWQMLLCSSHVLIFRQHAMSNTTHLMCSSWHAMTKAVVLLACAHLDYHANISTTNLMCSSSHDMSPSALILAQCDTGCLLDVLTLT